MPAYRDKIRVICHSLKMASLSGVDPQYLLSISSRIKGLPSAEKLSSMGHSELLDVSTRVERLIFDMDNARNSRTVGYAIKHRIDKGIPPRMPPVLAESWLGRAISGSQPQDSE